MPRDPSPAERKILEKEIARERRSRAKERDKATNKRTPGSNRARSPIQSRKEIMDRLT